jgi:adenylate kinase family enzyme
VQTTLGAELSEKLGIPHYSIDSLFWRPGWTETPVEELRANVKKLVEDHPEGWIIDGNYKGKLGEIGPWLEELATDVICMVLHLSILSDVFDE